MTLDKIYFIINILNMEFTFEYDYVHCTDYPVPFEDPCVRETISFFSQNLQHALSCCSNESGGRDPLSFRKKRIPSLGHRDTIDIDQYSIDDLTFIFSHFYSADSCSHPHSLIPNGCKYDRLLAQ
jgi:hypothetical protein